MPPAIQRRIMASAVAAGGAAWAGRTRGSRVAAQAAPAARRKSRREKFGGFIASVLMQNSLGPPGEEARFFDPPGQRGPLAGPRAPPSVHSAIGIATEQFETNSN